MIALPPPARRPAARPSAAGPVAAVARRLARHSQRRALLALDAAQLKDVGISAAEAWGEGHKPFWRAGAGRLPGACVLTQDPGCQPAPQRRQPIRPSSRGAEP